MSIPIPHDSKEPVTAAFRLPSASYGSAPPFHPGEEYPEYCGGSLGGRNDVYEGVRQLLRMLGLDEPRYGTAAWNPLGEIVRPGDRVVVKPNFISHAHRHLSDQWEQVVTHGSLIRAVVDYVLIALDGRGEICIADGPQLDADWDEIQRRTGTKQVCEWYQTSGSVPVRLLDLRDTWEDVRGDVLYGTSALPGDPAGAVEVDLASRSRFHGHAGAGRYYGATYDQAETNRHHSEGRHEYRISKTAASADVLINLPKMKTHKKTGVTLCLKNLVGVNSGRNWLPHHTDGDPSNGGDQFREPSLRSRSERWGVRSLERLTLSSPKVFAPIYRIAKWLGTPFFGHTGQVIRSGNWHGNDTCWRMVQDINRCLSYSDGEVFPTHCRKRFFAIVDGVVGGDVEGPASPDRYEAGVLIAGVNPVAVDCATTRLMGFDPMRIPMLRESFAPSDLPLAPFSYDDITLRSNRPEWEGPLGNLKDQDTYHFQAHFGWQGAIEWR
jgi:uncharacterized protein (DUF362 family)